ncbi:BamA/TamA family outer membrane protein [bacterium]|nr:BamA/TamA family outer membrane protein [bacterium]
MQKQNTTTGILILLIHLGAVGLLTSAPLPLHKIDISGNVELSDRTVLDGIKLQVGEIYEPEKLFDRLDSTIVNLGINFGFPFVDIDSVQFDFPPDSTYFDIVIHISEGLPAKVDTIILNGSINQFRDKLETVILTKPGSFFSPLRWNADVQRVVAYMEEVGYPFAEVSTHPLVPVFNSTHVGVIAGMTISPGRLVYLEDIRFKGLKRTRPQTAFRISKLKRSEPYNSRQLELARRNLLRTGWFSEVESPQLFLTAKDQFGVLFPVNEQPTSSFSGGLGYSPQADGADGIAGSMDAVLGNLFGGGRRFEIHWQRDNPKYQSFALRYREPYLFRQNVSGDLFFEQEFADSLYVLQTFGSELGFSPVSNWTVVTGITRRLSHADTIVVSQDSLSYTMTGLSAGVIVDTRDNVVNPREGGVYSVKTERLYAEKHAFLKNLTKNKIQLQQILSFSYPWVASIGLNYMDTRTENGTPPFSEWVRMGGITTIRGYQENALTAPRSAWLNLEARYLTGKNSRLYGLVDTAWLEKPKRSEWVYSYGLGALVKAGNNQLNVSVALPANEGWSAAVLHTRLITVF